MPGTNSAASRPTKITTELVGWSYGTQSCRQKTRRQRKSERGRKVNKAWKMAEKKTPIECSSKKAYQFPRWAMRPLSIQLVVFAIGPFSPLCYETFVASVGRLRYGIFVASVGRLRYETFVASVIASAMVLQVSRFRYVGHLLPQLVASTTWDLCCLSLSLLLCGTIITSAKRFCSTWNIGHLR